MNTRSLYPDSFKGLTDTTVKVSIVFLLNISCNNLNNAGYTVIKGPFRQSVIETGELQAVNSSTISMPRINSIYGYSLKIIGMAEHGKTIGKGDPVIEVDQSSVQKFLLEKSEAVENEIAAANKLKAEMRNNMQDLQAQLRNEQASYDIKKLYLKKSAFESEGVRKVIELEFSQAEIRLNKLKRNLELKPVLDSLEFLIQQIKVVQKENEVKAAQETLKQLIVRSPLNGIFVAEKNYRTNQAYKVGDEVYLGTTVARIPDTRTMKVNGIIQEADIRNIKTGLNVIVRLDALPSVPFHGIVSKIGKVCVEQDKKKIFQTEVLISESDLRLKPGMTVSCEYIIYDSENEIYIPSNCIIEENKHFYVFTRKRGKIRKTEIKPGPSNNMYTIVSGNLKPGQNLVLPDNILTK